MTGNVASWHDGLPPPSSNVCYRVTNEPSSDASNGRVSRSGRVFSLAFYHFAISLVPPARPTFHWLA